jgi:Bacterial regulatory protein, Fis family
MMLTESQKAAIEEYGITKAADILGIPRNTLKGRLLKYKLQDMGEFIPPEILSADEDLETVIAQLEAEDERREKARASLEWMEYQVRGDEPFALVFVGGQ